MLHKRNPDIDVIANAPELIRKFNNAKTIPHVAVRLTQLISSENSSFHEFEKLIRLDPTLVLRVLRMANSAYFALKQKVDSISRALVFIGMKNLRNMIVTEALRDIFKSDSEQTKFSRNHLWLHSAVVAICSQMISERILGQKGEDAFLCGILHDIGMIVEDQVAHEAFISVCETYQPNARPITDYETDTIGANHCELGYMLAQNWQLPFVVQEGVKLHHDYRIDRPAQDIVSIIQISEYIAAKLNYSALPDMTAALPPNLINHIKENMGEYKIIVKDLPDEIAKAKEIYESDE